MDKRNGILAAGNLIIDKINRIDRWPGQGELCNVEFERAAAGGGPCNVLCDLAALPAPFPLYALGRLGNDADGKSFREILEKRGIHTDAVVFSEKKPTSVTYVMSGKPQRTFFHDRGANAELDVEDIVKTDFNAKIFYLGYLLLLDQLDKPDPEFGTRSARVLKAMREKGLYVVVDAVSDAPEKFCRMVPPSVKFSDAVVFNELETAAATGIPLRTKEDELIMENLPVCAQKLFEMGLHDLAVIHFPEGAFAMKKNGDSCYQGSCIVNPETIRGSTGAGDAFCAGVLYGLHQEMPLQEIMRFGVCSAALNLRSPTACDEAPTFEELTTYQKNVKYRTK